MMKDGPILHHTFLKNMALNVESKSLQGVDVGAIERELRDLWKQMAEATQAVGENPVLRACVLNLVVYAPGEQSATTVSKIIAEITAEHPSRAIVMIPEPDAPSSSVSAWVAAQCRLTIGGRKQVCCEQIMIPAEGQGIQQLPSIVRSLLVPDLPVFLWWRDYTGGFQIRPQEYRVFNELVETADRVIVDSAMLLDPEDGLVKLAALIRERSSWAAFSDLNWSRLTPWRVSISGFFDVPDWRPYLARINRVEIAYEQALTDHRPISSQVLLIVGWLASRLKWRPTSKLQWTGHEYRLELAVKNRAIPVQIRASPSEYQATNPFPPPSLHTLRLVAEEEPSAEFVVSSSKGDPPDRLYLQTSVKLAGTHLTGDITGLNVGSEARLINTELEILTPDTVYEQALAMAAKIATNVHCPLSLAHCPLY